MKNAREVKPNIITPWTVGDFVTALQEGRTIPPNTVVDVLGELRTPDEIIKKTQIDRRSAPKSWFG